MPDSGWLKNLRETGWGFFLVVSLAGGTVAFVWRHLPGWLAVPHPMAPAYVEAASLAFFVVALSLLGWRLSKHKFDAPKWWKRRELRAAYKRLSALQVALLDEVHRTGSRKFDAPVKLIRQHFFEELEEMGFVRHIPQLIYAVGGPDPTMSYEITKIAWEVIDPVAQQDRASDS